MITKRAYGAYIVSRKNFLKIFGTGLLIFGAGLWGLADLFSKKAHGQKTSIMYNNSDSYSHSYYVFRDNADNSYKAINNGTGNIEFSSPNDAGALINLIINNYPSFNSQTGGGFIRLSSDVMNVRSTIILRNHITIEGAGIGTVLRLDDNQNKDVVKSNDFDNLVKSYLPGGVFGVTLSSLVIDGNKDHNFAGCGIRKYGYGWFLNNVIIRNCSQDGLWSQWSDSTNAPSTNLSMEDYYRDFIVNQNRGRGITFRGPHDSTAVQCFIWGNSDDGAVIESEPKRYSGDLHFVSSHIYANKLDGNGILLNQGSLEYSDLVVEGSYQSGGVGINCNGGVVKGNLLWCFDNDTGIRLLDASPCIMSDCYITKNRIGLELLSNDHVISGTLIDNNDRLFSNGTGLKIGNVNRNVSGNMLKFKISGSKTYQIHWANDNNYGNMLQALVYAPDASSSVAGNPNTVTNALLIHDYGRGILFRSSDGRTAGASYDANVQGMVNSMYYALRKRGLIT